MQLHSHQNEALAHIKKQEAEGKLRGGMLLLEMGLGKTPVILSLISQEKQAGSKNKTIIVCSKTLLWVWKDLADKQFPDLKVLPYHREAFKDYDNLTAEVIDEYDIVLTTYNILVLVDGNYGFSDEICMYGTSGLLKNKVVGYCQKDQPDFVEDTGPAVLYSYPWYRCVTDESQKFANAKTKSFRAICGLYSTKRWCLTGTPIRNKESDMWSLLFFCGLEEPSNPKDFTYDIYKTYESSVIIRNWQQVDLKLPSLNRHVEFIDFGPRV